MNNDNMNKTQYMSEAAAVRAQDGVTATPLQRQIRREVAESQGATWRGTPGTDVKRPSSKLQKVDNQYKQMFFKARSNVQRARLDIRAVQSSLVHCLPHNERNECLQTSSNAKTESQMIQGWRATRSQQADRIGPSKRKLPQLTSPTSIHHRRTLFNQSCATAQAKGRGQGMAGSVVAKPVLSGRQDLQLDAHLRSAVNQSVFTKATSSWAQTQAISPVVDSRRTRVPRECQELKLESFEDSLFSSLNLPAGPNSAQRGSMQYSTIQQTDLNSGEYSGKQRDMPADLPPYSTPGSKQPDESTSQHIYEEQQPAGYIHISDRDPVEERAVQAKHKEHASYNKYSARRKLLNTVHHPRSLHHTYQQQSIAYQAHLQRSTYNTKRMPVMIGSPEPAQKQPMLGQIQDQNIVQTPTGPIRQRLSGVDDGVFLKELIQERDKQNHRKLVKDFLVSFEGVRHKIDGASVRSPFLTKASQMTNKDQLEIVRSGVNLAKTDQKDTYRNNHTLAHRAIENYELLNESAKRGDGTHDDASRFLGFELHKRTSGTSCPQQRPEQPSNSRMEVAEAIMIITREDEKLTPLADAGGQAQRRPSRQLLIDQYLQDQRKQTSTQQGSRVHESWHAAPLQAMSRPMSEESSTAQINDRHSKQSRERQSRERQSRDRSQKSKERYRDSRQHESGQTAWGQAQEQSRTAQSRESQQKKNLQPKKQMKAKDQEVGRRQVRVKLLAPARVGTREDVSRLNQWQQDGTDEPPGHRIREYSKGSGEQFPAAGKDRQINSKANTITVGSRSRIYRSPRHGLHGLDNDQVKQQSNGTLERSASRGSSRVLPTASQFNIKKTQTLSNQYMVNAQKASTDQASPGSNGQLVYHTSTANSLQLRDRQQRHELLASLDSAQDVRQSVQIHAEDQGLAPGLGVQRLQALQSSKAHSKQSILNNSRNNRQAQHDSSKQESGTSYANSAEVPPASLGHVPEVGAANSDFLFSIQREAEQQERIEELITNFENVKADCQDRLQDNIESHNTHAYQQKLQWPERAKFVTHAARKAQALRAQGMPTGDELLRQFQLLLKESDKEVKAKKTQPEIMADYLKQDIFVQTMKNVVQDDIQELLAFAQAEDQIIFGELFKFLENQVVRDQISSMYEEFKSKQSSEDKLAREIQAALVRKEKKMADPETQRKIREAIAGADQRILDRKIAAEQRAILEAKRIRQFEQYLASRDVLEQVRVNTNNMKAKFIQLYKDMRSGASGKRRLGEEVRRLATLFGCAEADPLQIILQKIQLNNRRDDRMHSQAVREVALRGPKDQEFDQLVFGLCHDQTQVQGRSFVNQLFQVESQEYELAGAERRRQADEGHASTLDGLAPSGTAVSQPKHDADVHTASSVQEGPAGPLQEALAKFTKLAAYRQDQVDKKDFEGYNLEYISNLLRLKAALGKLCKYQTLQELYQALENNLFSLPKAVAGLHLLRQARTAALERGRPKKTVAQMLKEQRQLRRAPSAAASGDGDQGAENTDQSPLPGGVGGKIEGKECGDESASGEEANAAEQAPKSHGLELQSLVTEAVEKQSFYHRTKTGLAYLDVQKDDQTCDLDNLNIHWPDDEFEEEEDRYSKAKSPMEQLNAFLSAFSKHKALPLPSFAKIKRQDGFKQLYLAQYTLADEQCRALRNFLISQQSLTRLTQNPESLVNQPQLLEVLVLDNCGISDEGFAQVLVGLLPQKAIKSLSYLNNKIGRKSIMALEELLDTTKSEISLFEFNMHNTEGLVGELAKRLTNALAKQRELVHLKLSQINLNSEEAVQNLGRIIMMNHKILQRLDLSATCINIKYLCDFAENLALYPDLVRFLNLSYIEINAIEDSKKYTELFLQHLLSYLELTKVLTHINLTGMDLTKDQLLAISRALANAGQVQAIHLSDNQILEDRGLACQILNIFGINTEEAFAEPAPERTSHRKVVESYLEKIDPSIRRGNDGADRPLDVLTYKEHYIKGLTKRQISENKRRNLTQEGRGVGKVAFSQVDQFVLTRRLNCPELVFKRRESAEDSWFDPCGQSAWRLEREGSCYLCEKHKYTVFFFDQLNVRNNAQPNMGFKQIKDEAFCSYARKHFHGVEDSADSRRKDGAPILFGTFKRKVELGNRMINSSMYSLLSVLENEAINQNKDIAKDIKTGIVSLLEDPLATGIVNLEEKLGDHGRILKDKVLQNELVDISCLSRPQNIKRLSHASKLFVFADYLPPGHHQAIVYCPISDTFWFKDFMIDLCSHIPVTEYPKKLDSIIRGERVLQDVWTLVKQPEPRDDMFLSDLRQIGTHSFLVNNDMQRLINQKRTTKLLQDNYGTLCGLFDVLKSASEQGTYPFVSYQQVVALFTKVIDLQGLVEEVESSVAGSAKRMAEGEASGTQAQTGDGNADAGEEAKGEGEEGSDAGEEAESGPLRQLKLLIESAYFASKHPCKLLQPARTDGAAASLLGGAAADKARALSSAKQEELEKRRQDSLTQPTDRGGVLTFVLQLARQLSMTYPAEWTIETALQHIFQKLEAQLRGRSTRVQIARALTLQSQGTSKSTS